jgi:tetratricopeptide (TPR) repeat protein
LRGKPIERTYGCFEKNFCHCGSFVFFVARRYDALKKGNSADYDLGQAESNTLGYQLLYGDKKVGDAIAVFELNTKEHPTSSNAFDSLGEAYQRDGKKALAISSYQTAVKLDPTNGHAAAMLAELK